MVKQPNYRGISANFWRSLAAVGNAGTRGVYGTPFCGKGEPMQTGRTTQATAPARFRNVTVGVGYNE